MLKSLLTAGALLCLIVMPAYGETCQASHYGIGDGLHGRRTANGERFNAHGMTAAHRTKAFGTMLSVTSVATGKTVLVRVNDRGPYYHGRCIDLSSGAARAIGMSGTGLVTISP